MSPKLIYFDNNATTMSPDIVVKSIVKWINKGNPSAGYDSAKQCQSLFSRFRDAIATDCQFPLEGLENGYTIIFNSGASESNSHIVTSAARAYIAKTGIIPHIITSSVEHKSMIMCCDQLAKEKLIEVTFVPVAQSGEFYGTVDPEDVLRAIRPNTALITVMTTNNETGINNNIIKIGQIAAQHNVPFHTDAVQLFGRSRLKLIEWNIDAVSVSFHKLYGPPGIGALIVRNSLIAGYDLKAIVYGTQNNSLRGGTFNTPGIAGAYAGFKYTLENRSTKNQLLRKMRVMFMERIAKKVPCYYITEYDPNNTRPMNVVWICPKPSGSREVVVPWTIFMALDFERACNVKLKAELEKKGIIVSIGSACHTDSDKASHVVYELDIPKRLKGGVIRVSFGYDTKKEEVAYFADVLLDLMRNKKLIQK